jgi:hypothetical protein
MYRFDGLIVRRKAYVHLNPALMRPGVVPQDGYLFETIATRHRLLITASVIDKVATVQNNQLSVYCRQNPSMQNCAAVNERTKTWMMAVLALQLTTFPIG